MIYHTEAERRAALAVATTDLHLSPQETRTLDWLAGWDQGTVAAVITLLHKARRGTLEPPMPSWVASDESGRPQLPL